MDTVCGRAGVGRFHGPALGAAANRCVDDMLVSYSRNASFAEAVVKTFDGKHPCPMCLMIRDGRQQEERQQKNVPLIKIEKMPDFILDDRQTRLPFTPPETRDQCRQCRVCTLISSSLPQRHHRANSSRFCNRIPLLLWRLAPWRECVACSHLLTGRKIVSRRALAWLFGCDPATK